MSRNYELLRSMGEKLEFHQHSRIALSGNSPPSLAGQIPATQTCNFEWRSAVVALQRHWRLAAAFAAIVIVTVSSAVFTQRPFYEPVATIEIDQTISEPGFSNAGGSDSTTAEYLETQAKNLGSDETLVAVIRHLHLDQNSEFIGKPGGSFFSRLNPFGRVTKPAEESAFQGSEQPDSVFRLSEKENIALRSFRSHLTISRDTSSRLVSATFSSHDPRLAAVVANTLVNLFIERSYTTRHDAIMKSSVWLSKQLDDVKEAMQKSNATLADYERTWGIAALGEDEKQGSTFTQRVAELNRQLAQAEADRIQLQAYVGGLERTDDVQQVGSDPMIQNLRQKLSDVRTALSEAIVVYGANHPNVKKLQNQTSELQLQISAQREAIISRLKTSYADAQAREKLLSQEMRAAMDQSSRVGQYNILRKEAQANRDLYNALYTRVKEASISAESQSSNIHVVDRARILDRPTRPQRTLTITIGLFVGLLGGVVIALIKDKFDPTIRNPEDIKRSTGISAISIMPIFESRNGSRTWALGTGFMPRKENYRITGARKFVLEKPRSPEAEALRGLQMSIMFCRLGSSPQVIQIVSSFAGEGKTTIAVNLAVALAKHGKTCLVDADLRKPEIADSFGLLCQQGLADVLMSSALLGTVLVDLPDGNLTLLPAGVLTGDPGQIFIAHSMNNILGTLRERFRYVVIDSPPIIPYADGRATACLADGLILVGRYGCTSREAMARSTELLTQVSAAPIIEVVLNAANDRGYEYRYQATS